MDNNVMMLATITRTLREAGCPITGANSNGVLSFDASATDEEKLGSYEMLGTLSLDPRDYSIQPGASKADRRNAAILALKARRSAENENSLSALKERMALIEEILGV